MNLRSLQVFVHVMEEGTLARASARMNLSQPAASRLIRILEDEFDVTLFFRDKKRLTPTPEGEVFYLEALRILSSVDEIPEFFNQIKSNAVRPLRIICHPRIVNGLVMPAMIELSRREPKQRMKLEVHPRRDLGRRIMRDMYDIGVSSLPLPVENLVPHILTRSELKVVLPKGHRLAAKACLTPDDVDGEPYIALDETTLLRRLVDRELTKIGRSLAVTHEVSTSSAAYRLAKNGLGFTFTDQVTLDPDIAHEFTLVPWSPSTSIELGYFVSNIARPHVMREIYIEYLRNACANLNRPG